MHRLFVAIRPPAPIREQLLATMEGVQNARWQGDDQLHLTLRFIGNVDRHRAEDVATALDGLHAPAFRLRLSGVGCFERRGKGTLWAGVTPAEPLRALHRRIDQACIRAGLPPEARAYHPHITVARIARDTEPLAPFLQRWAALASCDFPIDRVHLYESRLGSDGARYSPVATYRLSRPAAQAPSPTSNLSTMPE